MNRDAPRPAPVPVLATLRAAFRLVLANRRETLVPIAAIQVPVTLLLTLVTIVASLTVLRDEPLDPLEDGARGTLFVFLVTVGAQVLFSQVARGAAITASAAAARGQSLSVSASLDPAFSRMGGIISLAIVLFAMAGFVVVPFVGWVLGPYLALRAALSFEAFMLEGVRPLAAIRRSWELTSGRLLRLAAVVGLSALALLGPLMLVSLLGGVVGGSRTQEVLLGGAYSVAQGVIIIPVVAFITATTTLFYLQAAEGFDVGRDV